MNNENQPTEVCITPTQINIIFNSRLFWRETVYWSRALFNSVFLGIGNSQEVFARLFNTPTGYAYTLRLILERSVADEYGILFRQHTVLLRQLLSAAISGETNLINEAVSDLYQNAEERAIFLSKIFPSLDKVVLQNMFDKFIQNEIEEINLYITGDYRGLIESYDNILMHADETADYLASGIINLITAAPVPTESDNLDHQEICICEDQLNAILDIAMFWIDFIAWFRIYRISVIEGIGNQEELYNKLIQVTIDFGNTLKQFTENEAVDAFILLLHEYIDLMNRMLDARLAGNVEEMNQIYRMTIDNIDASADFLGMAFPTLTANQWRKELISMHSDLIEMAGMCLQAGKLYVN